MTIPASQDPSLGFLPGDHVCAFYNRSRNVLDGMLNVLTEDEAYMPDGHFSKDTFISNMQAMVLDAFAHGYDSFRAVGDESFLVNGILIGNPHYQADQFPG
jgi:hypothetical protein